MHEVAIVGAGPIGLELAVALKQAQIDYVHFDAAQIGSTIAWYPLDMLFHSRADRLAIAGVPIQIPDQQKPKREEYLAYLRAVAQQFDLRVRTFTRVTRIERLAGDGFELTTVHAGTEEKMRVRFVVLSVGAMHAPRYLGIPGEESPHVSHYFRDPHDYFGRRLLIVGGRNSAIEAAVRCQRAGAVVTLSYRRTDFDAAKVKWWLLPEIRGMVADARVRFLPNTLPREIRGTSVLLEDLADGTLSEMTFDAVLVMTGYRQDTTLFEQLGVDLESDARRPAYDEMTMETNVPGVFVAGTAVAGTPASKVSVIVETCHVHVARIVAAISGRPVESVTQGREDD